MDNTRETVFKHKDGSLVVINQEALNKLLAYRQLDSTSPEAGGVLIGERRGNHLVICDISEPGLNDIQSRYSINRKGKHHQQKVISSHRHSGGYLHYLGEWHSHPEDIPTPSSQDFYSWKKHLKSSVQSMSLVIVGRKGIWVGKIIRGVIRELKYLT